MMDGRIGAIRGQLDADGFERYADHQLLGEVRLRLLRPIPRRRRLDARSGDRRGYQMDPANVLEAIRESKIDLDEGADMLMVKPALPYLDVIRRVKEATGAPLAAYHVSGEYSMLKAAVEAGWLDERAARARGADRDPPRRRGRDHHLLRQGRCKLA